MLRSLSVQVLIALGLGLVCGEAILIYGGDDFKAVLDGVQAVGSLWLNALRMTVVPLIFSLLVTGIASVADAASTGRLAWRSVALFSVLIVIAAVYGTAMAQFLLSVWPVDSAQAQAFVASAKPADAAQLVPPTFTAWLQGLAPTNVLRAAADDQILQLVIFAVIFGFAATRVPSDQRLQLVTFFKSVESTMVVIVRWVLVVAPVGVFALALGVGTTAGLGAAGVLAQYIAIVSLSMIGILVLAVILAVAFGGIGPIAFLRASAPALVVAASTQSSLATLPAMVECARNGLGVPARVTDLVLPLAVAIFRLTSPVGNLGVAYFIAHVTGIEPTPMQMAGAIFAAFAASVGAVGLPGQVSFFLSMTPICLALGVPPELLGILLAVEVVPDIFRTLGNVTGDLAVAAILKREGKDGP